MTSQVAVANFYGVAVASDTVSSRKTSQGWKTSNHNNKIFALGDEHNVLILHANLTVINDVPASLMVTEWAKTLSHPLDTVQEYIDSFVRWANESVPLRSEDSERQLARQRICSHFEVIASETQSKIQVMNEDDDGKLDADIDTHQLFLDALQASEAQLSQMSLLENTTVEEFSPHITDWESMISSEIEEHFARFGVADQDLPLIIKTVGQSLAAYDYLTDSDCLLAFVGFGKREAFPFIRQIAIRGYYDKKLRLSQFEARSIKPGSEDAPISFFAQSDSIFGFLEGIHPRVKDKLHESSIVEIQNEFGDSTSYEQADRITHKVMDLVGQYTYETFISPLLTEVSNMNIRRLADFADSLVGLQATAAKSLDGPATVGGYIEVATIDRENGVRWVKNLDASLISQMPRPH